LQSQFDCRVQLLRRRDATSSDRGSERGIVAKVLLGNFDEEGASELPEILGFGWDCVRATRRGNDGEEEVNQLFVLESHCDLSHGNAAGTAIDRGERGIVPIGRAKVCSADRFDEVSQYFGYHVYRSATLISVCLDK
jgi:hypothetical protein